MFPILIKLLTIDGSEVTFARRGFSSLNPVVRDRLELVGAVFLVGYHAALQENKQEALTEKLERVELQYRGFLARIFLRISWKAQAKDTSLCFTSVQDGLAPDCHGCGGALKHSFAGSILYSVGSFWMAMDFIRGTSISKNL
jgi:hypothetical protein